MKVQVTTHTLSAANYVSVCIFAKLSLEKKIWENLGFEVLVSLSLSKWHIAKAPNDF